MGMDHYADLRNAGKEAGPDLIAMFLQSKMINWHPKVMGKEILDDETKAAGARFLAGVVINFSD